VIFLTTEIFSDTQDLIDPSSTTFHGVFIKSAMLFLIFLAVYDHKSPGHRPLSCPSRCSAAGGNLKGNGGIDGGTPARNSSEAERAGRVDNPGFFPSQQRCPPGPEPSG